MAPHSDLSPSETSVPARKAALRNEALARRDALREEDRRIGSLRIAETVMTIEALAKVEIVGAFWPIRSEVDPRPLARLLFARGQRIALPNARVMVHQPSGGFRGQASDIEIHAREILTIRERLNKVLAHHTGQPMDVIARDTDRDNFMSGPEAVAYGLIDKVLEKRNIPA